jgi:NADPH-dependent glutamate synthase beta subunit-like oxidoreductase
MLSLAIPTFRLPPEMVDREIQGLTYPSMQFRFGQALGRDYGVRDLEREHDAVFLSPGLWSGRTLGLPGADHAAITDALALLTSFREKGKVKVKSRVLVIGGGSVAADAAMTCRVSGAEQVTMVCLEQESEMPALPGEVQGLRQQGVEILNGWGPREFLSGSRMAFRCCVSVFDENRVFAPSYDESRVMEREFDQVVLAVGQTPEPQLARTLEKEFGRSDRIEVDPVSLQVRGRGGVFAGGDIVRGAGTVVQAVADGRRAARAIDARLRQRS